MYRRGDKEADCMVNIDLFRAPKWFVSMSEEFKVKKGTAVNETSSTMYTPEQKIKQQVDSTKRASKLYLRDEQQ